MAKNRKAAEEYILTYIKKLTTDDTNLNLYRNMFKEMNDSQFDEFMTKLKNKEINLALLVPPGKDNTVSLENNIKIYKELGGDFFQHIKVGPTEELPGYTTPNKYMVFKAPVRRAAQLLIKKRSIAKDPYKTDLLSGQVAGDSKACRITLPEIQLLLGIDSESMLKELLKTRGGDLQEFNALNAILYKTGSVTQAMLSNFQSGVVSTKTLNAYLLSAHIRSTLIK